MHYCLENYKISLTAILFTCIHVLTLAQNTACTNESKSYEVDNEFQPGDTVDGTPGSIYEWQILETSQILPTTSNRVTIDWSAYTTGTYTLQVIETSVDGCPGDPEQITIELSEPPTAPTIDSPSPVCSGDNTSNVFTIRGAVGDVVAYTLSGGDIGTETVTLTDDGNGNGIATVSVVDDITANTSITLNSVSNATGTCITTLTGVTAEITVADPPTFGSITTSITPNTEICAGESFEFQITGTAGSTITYNINGAADQTLVLTSGTGVIPITAVAADGSYTITVSRIEFSSGLGCGVDITADNSATVTVNPAPNTNFTLPADSEICASATEASFTITSGTEGETLTLNVNGTTQTFTFNANGEILVTILAAEFIPGNQFIELISVDTPAGCSATVSGRSEISLSAALSPPNLTAVEDICVNDQGEFTLTGSAGLVVNYNVIFTPSSGGTVVSVPGNATLDASGNFTITTNTATETGTFVVEITSVNNGTCSTNFNAGDVVSNPINVNPLPETSEITPL